MRYVYQFGPHSWRTERSRDRLSIHRMHNEGPDRYPERQPAPLPGLPSVRRMRCAAHRRESAHSAPHDDFELFFRAGHLLISRPPTHSFRHQ